MLTEGATVFMNNIDQYGYHTDIYDELDLHLFQDFSAIISTRDGFLTHFGVGTRSTKVASKKRRLKITTTVALPSPIDLRIFVESREGKIRELWQRISEAPHLADVTPNGWNGIWDYIKENYETSYLAIRGLLDRWTRYVAPVGELRREIVFFEKDAFSLAMKISGFDALLNQGVVDQYDNLGSGPILKNLEKVVVREDLMVIHDAEILEGFKIDEKTMVSTSLTDGIRKITILYANRMPLEQTLGVDLIYVDDINQTMVLVQYKRLTGGSEKIYRPSSDKNFEKEMRLIEEIQATMSKTNQNSGGYRFNDDAFYFKFCRDIQPISTRDLVDGMYLPISYFRHLLDDKLLQGENGGTVISYGNVLGHFNNTVFVSLLKTGLIGANQQSFQILKQVVEKVIATGRSLLFAKFGT
jgi:hypothetical protein